MMFLIKHFDFIYELYFCNLIGDGINNFYFHFSFIVLHLLKYIVVIYAMLVILQKKER